MFLLLLGVLAGGVLVWVSQGETESPDDTWDPLDEGLGAPPPRKRSGDEPGESAPAIAASPRGLPRILPPGAAIEDVRDALAVTKRSETVAMLQMAYDSIGRIAQQPRILTGLQRYALAVEDPQVRGAVYAALGANTSGPSRAWLAARLKDGPTLVDRVGALLGLAYDAGATEAYAEVFGGLPHLPGALPERLDVRDGLAVVLAALEKDPSEALARGDVAAVLRASLAKHPKWFAKERAAMRRLSEDAKK
jgi:hypothetical protein